MRPMDMEQRSLNREIRPMNHQQSSLNREQSSPGFERRFLDRINRINRIKDRGAERASWKI
jgi:hypothetical protein